MKKDEILNASRKEQRNKDLAEMEVVYQSGSHASRVGAVSYTHLDVYKRQRYQRGDPVSYPTGSRPFPAGRYSQGPERERPAYPSGSGFPG